MIHDAGYLSRLEDLEWYPWTIDAVRLLNRAGFLVCVTSNQGGIGLGLFPETFVRDVQAAMTQALESGGARVDAWFYCPHHPGAVLPALRVDCECRKPKPGMIREATNRFSIDLAASFVVGDKAADIGLARSAGTRGVLVKTGAGAAELARSEGGPAAPKLAGGLPSEGGIGADHVAADLMGATMWILEQSGFPRVTA